MYEDDRSSSVGEMNTSPSVTQPEIELMDVEQLLKLNCTTSEAMEGVPRMRQHSNVHTQIQAYEKLLQHANSKFSREKLHQNLKLIHWGLPYLKGNKIVYEAGNHGTIESVKQLKDCIERLQQQKRKGIQKEEESAVVQYFETFLRELQFLKNLKAYFDERIYSALYQYYYDPLDSSLDDIDDKLEDADSGHSSQNGSDDESKAHKPTPRTRFSLASKIECRGAETLEYSPERERLLSTVKELYDLNQKWEKLFDESKIETESFDTESSYEIHMYKDLDNYKQVFRLVPDIFTKGFKSVRLAKIWWMNANKLYKPEPEKSVSNMDTIQQKLSQLQNLLAKIKTDIVRSEQTIYVFQNDLQIMKERQVVNMTAQTKKVQKRTDNAKKRYNEIVKRRNELKEKLADTIQGTTNYNLLAMQLRDTEIDLADYFDENKLLECQIDLIQGDSRSEKTKEPQFKKFAQGIEVKISKLRELIVEKKLERRRIEKAIVLLKTNTERMSEIVNRGLRAVSPILEEATMEEEATGPSFFLTQADDIPEITIEAPPSVTNETSVTSAPSSGDKETHEAVQDRLKQLYADFDFDHRYRPASVASEGSEVTPEVSDTEEATPVGFRGPQGPQRTRGRYVNHTYPLKRDEYILKPK